MAGRGQETRRGEHFTFCSCLLPPPVATETWPGPRDRCPQVTCTCGVSDTRPPSLHPRPWMAACAGPLPCRFSLRQTVRGSAWGRGCRGGFPGSVGSGGQPPPHSFARVPPKVSGRAFAWGTFLYKMAGIAKRTQAQKSK